MNATVIEEMDRRRGIASGWRRGLIALVLVLGAAAFVMQDAIVRLWDLWMNNAGYGHGILVVPVAMYLLWIERARFAASAPVPNLLGLLATAVLMLLWSVSRALGIVLGEQLVLVFAVLALVWTVLGTRVARIAALPILYVLTAVPVWTYLVPLLQENTATASTALGRALGIPIYLEGLYINIPDGRFVVADVCAGMRYLLAAIALAGFYALLNLRRLWAQATLVVAAFVMGVVFNWVRVTGIVMIGHYSKMQSPLVESHIGFGWALFLAVVVLTLLLGRVLERLEGAPAAAAEVSASSQRGASTGAFGAAALLSAVLLVAPALVLGRLLAVPPATPVVGVPVLPAESGWTQVARPEFDWRPLYYGAGAELLARYRRGGAEVDLYVAYYPVQRQDAEVVNDNNDPYDSDGWWRFDVKPVPDRVRIAPRIPGAEFLIRSRTAHVSRMVWRTWWVNGSFTADSVHAKLLQVLGLVSGRASAAAVLLSTPIEGSKERAAERLRGFARAAEPGLLAALEGGGRSMVGAR